MNQMKSNHKFAFFFPALQDFLARGIKVQESCIIDDEPLVHRMVHVLRLEEGGQCMLFDRCHHGVFTILNAGKKRVTGSLKDIRKNTQFMPTIIYCVPLLKRDALESALYALTEMGVNSIQLVDTQKIARAWMHKEFERCQRVIIAAAEQSKYFAYPQLLPPISFEEAVVQYMGLSVYKIYCDPEGVPLMECIEQVRALKPTTIIIMAGPEADLTPHEKMMLRRCGVVFCALTPTILRSFQAITLSAGMFRAIAPQV